MPLRFLRALRAPVFVLCLACFNYSVAAADIKPIETTLSDDEKALIAWVDERSDTILAELRTHVEMNTGTANIAGLDAYRELFDRELSALGFTTETHSSAPLDILSCAGGQQPIADHLVARLPGGTGQRLLLNGHMDTVFSVNDEFQTLEIGDNGVLKGPGVADMKGGLVVMLNALRALQDAGLLQDTNMTVLLNTDEEIGSLGSRALIEQLAGEHDLGVVFEGSYQNEMTRARKGLGQVRLKVNGRESHAGSAHEDGVSANLELAHKIVAIEALTDYEAQSTVNVGVMGGGEKRNTIPGCADAYVDMRFVDTAAGQKLLNGIRGIAEQTTVSNPRHAGLPTTEFWGTLHRPAKAGNATVDRLIAEAMGLSALIGEPVTGARYAGGGTDGSIMQGAGLPAVDSMGMDGAGAHSSREESTMASLIARTKLAAVMLSRLITAE